MRIFRLLSVLGCLSVPAHASTPTPAQIIAAAPDSAWTNVAPDDVLVMQLADGATVLIQLAPGFAPVHVADIRALARAGWWDGAAIVREQDDYVVQWARMPEGQKLPTGVIAHPPAEYERPVAGTLVKLGFPYLYAKQVGWVDGWPVASDGRHQWLTHCYAMAGVGRDMPPDTGSGEELYAVNGQAPRQLDRNIALIGRVAVGMDTLSALPRGTAALGFYTQPAQWLKIVSVRVAADLPPVARPTLQFLDPSSPAFQAALAARANRRDAFFVRPAGSVDLCNVPVPTRLGPTRLTK